MMRFLEKLFNIGFKISIVLAILVALMIGSLKLLERQKEPLQQGIEQYFSQSSGMDAKIGSIDHIAFFPDLDLVFKDLNFYRASDPDFFPMRVQSITLKMPFSSVFFSRRILENLDIQNFESKADIVTPKALKITNANISYDGQTDPFIHVRGLYDDAEMEAHIGLQLHKRDQDRTFYKIGSRVPFYTQIGTVYLNGTFEHDWNGSVFKGAVLKVGSDTYGPYNLEFDPESGTVSILQCLLQYGQNEQHIKEHCARYFKE